MVLPQSPKTGLTCLCLLIAALKSSMALFFAISWRALFKTRMKRLFEKTDCCRIAFSGKPRLPRFFRAGAKACAHGGRVQWPESVEVSRQIMSGGPAAL